MRIRNLRFALLILAFAAAPWPAKATSFYVESGMGVSQFRAASGLFTDSEGVATDMGLAFGLGIFFATGDGRNPIEFQIGLQPRLSSSSDANGSYSLLSAYPIVRLQISRLYLGGGYAPYVYKRSAATAGFDAFTPVTGGRNLMAEIGALFPVTPDFSLALSGVMNLMRSDAGLSPKTLDYLFSMRFYFGHSGASGGGSEKSSNEFKGWRYPFGFMR